MGTGHRRQREDCCPHTAAEPQFCSDMMGDRGTKVGYQLKLDNFTQPKDIARAPQPKMPQSGMETSNPEEDTSTLKDIMDTIKGLCGTLESKIDSVSTEVVLMRADFHKLGARVKETEDSLKLIKDGSTR
ncbi:hypothetical protein NDU88_002615 [Pleurodeles waltl]|uniref:Uncharacterized protein n=1 Tax=Pleurodeles waltl TaxID=8319 RepID=A0AAV7MNX1_PLEWA|nr:hypothetical protein NDU88_002615 [Pleurodeles waltl]